MAELVQLEPLTKASILKRERFCRLILGGKNKAKAYVEAGYKPGSPLVIDNNARRLLQSPWVAERLRVLREDVELTKQITKDWWLGRHMQVMKATPTDFLNDDLTMKALGDISADALGVVEEFTVKEVVGKEGTVRTITVKLMSKQNSLAAIGKGMGYSEPPKALEDKTLGELTLAEGAALLEAARARAQANQLQALPSSSE